MKIAAVLFQNIADEILDTAREKYEYILADNYDREGCHLYIRRREYRQAEMNHIFGCGCYKIVI
jgi:hypothetical protein